MKRLRVWEEELERIKSAGGADADANRAFVAQVRQMVDEERALQAEQSRLYTDAQKRNAGWDTALLSGNPNPYPNAPLP